MDQNKFPLFLRTFFTKNIGAFTQLNFRMKQNLLKNTEDVALEIYFLLVRFYGCSNISRIANNLLEDFISIGNKFELNSF